jgi:branched-chain amino acid transport system permease protein
MPLREPTGVARSLTDLSRWRLNELLFWTVALMAILLFQDFC